MESQEKNYVAWLKWTIEPIKQQVDRSNSTGDTVVQFPAKDDSDARKQVCECADTKDAMGHISYQVMQIWEVARKVPKDEEEMIAELERIRNEQGREEVRRLLESMVEVLELSVRAYNSIKNASIRTVRELVQKTEKQLAEAKTPSGYVRQFSRRSIAEIKDILAAKGLRLGMSDEEIDKLLKSNN